MATEHEGTFEVDGKSLYTKSWLPENGEPKAKLIFIHGYSDHVNRYNAMFRWLAGRGIAVHGFDQRGWGRSVTKPAEKGLTGPTSRVLADIAAFIKPHLPPAAPAHPPVFVMGHSMGGGEALTLASHADYQDDVVRHVRGWVLESPFIGFTPEETPGALKVFGARLVGRFMPNRQMYNKLAASSMSRDPAVVKSIEEDELMHDTGTLEGLASLLDRTTALATGVARPGSAVRSLWVGHGDNDKVTNYHTSKKYFEQCLGDVPDKHFKTYEGWYHQLHNDGPQTEEFYKDVAEWILARAGEESAQSKL
ncbi:putative monoglyceride lipase [Echria macrotheca]|uniref:Monoglyceride lipase n=1 Tax=Echria macrotheca TaxID=438768 RepID=A0AAJ0FH74_9PEZI|nr:putative monoglyceride lipase [Echria macrotheca]